MMKETKIIKILRNVRKKKTQQTAITLAEIMIVVVIVAIVGLVFMAMPKKNVRKMDKVKYYMAYSMLKRLQDEQMAENNFAAINKDTNSDESVGDNEKFCKAVDKLNTVDKTCSSEDNSGNATLTNGMYLNWVNAVTSDGYLKVTVDLDGSGNGANAEGKDNHIFYLSQNGDVIPKLSNAEWLSFRVYHITQSGTNPPQTVVDKNTTDYNTAKTFYCCKTVSNDKYSTDQRCKYYNSSSSSITNVSSCDGVPLDTTNTYFMEAIKPL